MFTHISNKGGLPHYIITTGLAIMSWYEGLEIKTFTNVNSQFYLIE